jgi:YD repeat-containing protein
MIDPNFDPSSIPLGYTFDDAGRVLTFRGKAGFWSFSTRDEAGRLLTYCNSHGYREDYTYDDGAATVTRTAVRATSL